MSTPENVNIASFLARWEESMREKGIDVKPVEQKRPTGDPQVMNASIYRKPSDSEIDRKIAKLQGRTEEKQ